MILNNHLCVFCDILSQKEVYTRAKPAPKQAVRVAQPGANRLPNQPDAPMPPPHLPVPHTLCPLGKLNMCNSLKCPLLVRHSMLLFSVPLDPK